MPQTFWMQFSIALENQEELRLHVTAWAEHLVVLPQYCCIRYVSNPVQQDRQLYSACFIG